MPKAPDSLNATDLIVIDLLCQATAELHEARAEYGVGSPEWMKHRAAVDVLRSVLSQVGFDSDGIDEMLDR